MPYPALHISQTIDHAPDEVAAFAGNPANLPRWAAGLASGIRNDAGTWISESPMGSVEVHFSGPLEHGILDHDVTLPDGTVVYSPLRVLQNAEGAEIVFTLYRLPAVSDEEFARDAGLIRADLARLRDLLETD